MFDAPRPARVRRELARMPGVMRVEPFRAVPVRLRNGYRSERTQLLGYQPDAELVRVMGRDLDPITLPPAGVVLTTQLAGMLAVRPGDVPDRRGARGARARSAACPSPRPWTS